MSTLIGLALTSSLVCGGINSSSKKTELKSMIEKEALQYSECKVKSDCTFFTQAGGFAINIKGLGYVSNCAKSLSKSMFPECHQEGPQIRKMDPGLKADPHAIATDVDCEENRCVAKFGSGPQRGWFVENSRYLADGKNRPHPGLDSLCIDFLKVIESKSQK
jgi:hypothetical protein